MPLDFQLVQAPFRFGLAEGADPHAVPPGTLMTAENVCWRKGGRIEKRYGTTTLTSAKIGGGSLPSAKRLMVRDKELCLTDGSRLYSYTTSGWADVGRVPQLSIEWSTHLDSVTGVKSADMAILSNGNVVMAWVSGTDDATLGYGAIYYQVRSQDGSVVTAPTLLTSSWGGTDTNRVVVVTDGTNWAILFSRYPGAGSCTLYASVNGATPSLLRSDHRSFGGGNISGWDACTVGSNFVIAYARDAGAGNGIGIYSYTFASTPVQVATGAVGVEAAGIEQDIGIHGTAGENLYVVYSLTSGGSGFLKYGVNNPSTFAVVSNAATIDSAANVSWTRQRVTRIDATNAVVVSGATSLVAAAKYTDGCLVSFKLTVGVGPSVQRRESRGLLPVSRPFTIGEKQYVFAAECGAVMHGILANSPPTTVGWNTLLLDVTPGSDTNVPHEHVGNVEVLTGAFFDSAAMMTPCTYNGQTQVLVPFHSKAPTRIFGWHLGLRIAKLTLGNASVPDIWRGVEIDRELYVSGALLTAYDGRRTFNAGFCYPSLINKGETVAATTTGLMDAGTYLYSVVPEYRSASGMLHRGPPAATQSIVVGGTTTSKVSLCVMPQSVDWRETSQPVTGTGDNSPFAHLQSIFRSVKNGSIPQRLTLEPDYNTHFSDHQNGSNQTNNIFVDIRNDSNITGSSGYTTLPLASRDALYTSGGELEDMQPPSLVTMALHSGRLFGVDGTGRRLWFTKDYDSNVGTSPGWHPALSMPFAETLTALASMDEKLVVFSASSMWIMVGEGPAPTGIGSDDSFANPIKVQTDVGCTNARSVVSTPMGVMFQSARGIYLLTRGLEQQWIGRAVRDQLDAYPNITSAVLVPKQNQVRFTANNSDSTAGIVFVYDYVEGQWSTFRYSVGGTASLPIADAVMWQDSYVFATTGGLVAKETPATHLDDSTWVTMTLETAWISAAGPVAYHSARRFTLQGEAHTNHSLVLEAGFDSNTAYQQTVTFATASDVTTPGPLEECQLTVNTRRKCNSIRFKVYDLTPTGGAAVSTGKGASFYVMGLEVGVKKGGNMPATRKG
jgi:hypothetical protein